MTNGTFFLMGMIAIVCLVGYAAIRKPNTQKKLKK